MAATVFSVPHHTTALKPAFAAPAPMRPPIRACELDEGIAPHQVSRFHTMAPISAPKMTCPSTMSGEMIPVPTVCATCKPKNKKAMKLKNAAQTTATLGESTRVETTVAIELAASCRPLRKSKMRATATRATSSMSESGIAEGPPVAFRRAR